MPDWIDQDVIVKICVPLLIAAVGWSIAIGERVGARRLVVDIKTIGEALTALDGTDPAAEQVLRERLQLSVRALHRRNAPDRTARRLTWVALILATVIALGSVTWPAFTTWSERGFKTIDLVTIVGPIVFAVLLTVRLWRALLPRPSASERGSGFNSKPPPAEAYQGRNYSSSHARHQTGRSAEAPPPDA